MKKKRSLWKPQEIEYLKANYADTYTSALCKNLDRSYSAICYQAYKLNLYKSGTFMDIELQKQANRIKIDGKQFQFSKGQTPPNKGQKMSSEVYEKVKYTMFKKGEIPRNTKQEGYEMIDKDGYVKIKVQDKMAYKHRVIWEQHNDKLNKGDVVRFKDGNKLNCTIENLELVSRSENMIKNTIHRFPEEVKSTIKLLTKLKKKIKHGTE
jgi:hypothetical protein